MYADETFRLTLIAVGAGREPVFLDSTTRWTTSDTTVATLSYSKDTQTDLIGIRPGTVTIRASVGVYTTSVVLTVLPAPILTNGGFVVEAFSVIEYQYSSAPNRWYYAPQLRVRGSTVSDLKLIKKLTFEFSGVPNVAECNASIVIAGMQPNDLFREIYGDYQLEFDFGGKLPSGTTALAHITLTEGTGTQVLTVAGPVVSGALPTTYTGGNPQWLCR